MSEQLTFYKLFAEKNYSVEIPIIQRDYAQGRASAKEIRTEFLKALHGYLEEDIPFRDIDFIYGDIDAANNFIPLDGQQRLTTLFLLHYYLALKEDKLNQLKEILVKNGLSRFTYKTRQSAADFCNALFKNEIILPSSDDAGERALSETIKDSSWYFLSWDNDPTIRSMLCMLDAIHCLFKNTKGFYDRLVDKKQPVITFQFLTLNDYGLTEDLYIKMNSRGKPLTKFENFKAKFEQHLGRLNGLLAYPPNVRDYFSHRIDTRWAHLFWTYRNKKENLFDRQIMNFISVLAINQYAINQDDPKKYIDHQGDLPLEFYLHFNEQTIPVLIDALDQLSVTAPAFKVHLPGFHYYDETAAFDDIINDRLNAAGYAERIKFFAYYCYLVQWKGANELAKWMRVVVNLTENTIPYNSETEFINSLRAIQRLLPFSDNILPHLTAAENITGFNPSQIKEEQIKAHMILISTAWEERIYEAEKHPYFKGQITFALVFSGIEDHYDEKKNCGWDQEADRQYLEAFDHYINLVFSLFDDGGLKPEAKEVHRLHRAILTKGRYLLYAKSNYSFLVDRERDISWKRLLQGDDYRKVNREFLKQVITDPAFNPTDLRSLDDICNNAKEHLKPWEKKFVDLPELFEYLGNSKYIRCEDDMTYLLTKVRLSAEHSELFTHALYLYLKPEGTLPPFDKMYYYFADASDDTPCLCFNAFKCKDHEFEMDIYYEGGLYKAYFYDQNMKQIGDHFIKLLKENEFVERSDKYELVFTEAQVEEKLKLLSEFFSNWQSH
jgi:Protein of unknown function DUF262